MTPTEQRRARLMAILRSSGAPVTGGDLSSALGVSRQAIVNDVAILRAMGEPILGSPRGYVRVEGSEDRPIATIACRHDEEGNRREFEILVDRGIDVIDVVVEHPVYGEVAGTLLVRSRADVDRYMEAMQHEGVQPLWALTDGVHLHHLHAPSADALDAAKRELAEAGILLAHE